MGSQSTDLKVGGVVVLYNPPIDFFENVLTYLQGVEKLLIVDNTEGVSNAEKIPNQYLVKIIYINNGENRGIAKALNQGATWAIESGFDWLLTMDQDSGFLDNGFEKLKSRVHSIKDRRVAIVSPIHITKTISSSGIDKLHSLDVVMTSGNLLNLQIYQSAGVFEDKLIIDYVDHEYCLRLRKKGYLVFQFDGSLLRHNLGDIAVFTVLNIKFATSNHNAIRRYYISRNRLYVMFKYLFFRPSYFLKCTKSILVETLLICFAENDKGEKILNTLLGSWHFLIGRFGKK